MSTPEQFEREMIQFGFTAERNAVKAVRTAVVVAAKALGRSTPADVGTAISNWQASISAPASGTKSAFVPGTKGATRSANAAAMVAEVEAIAALYVSPEASLHLTNNLPYIERLNAGSSKQAPALFVEAAIAKGLEAAKYVRLLD